MLSRSLSSVKVTWLDRKRVLTAVEEGVMELVGNHPEIEEVLMFGSMARGGAVPGSDVDLLVILSRDSRTFLQRIADYMFSIEEIGVDVFPYTRDEIRKMTESGNLFLKRALKEGITIYERGKT